MNGHVRRILGASVALLLAFMGTLPVLAQDYGTGVVVQVPEVDPTALTMDGMADEAAWDDATTLTLGDGNFTNWSGGWNDDYGPEIDIGYTAKLLYAEDTLYVHILFEDYQDLYWGGEGNPWGGEQIFIGIDGTLAGDDQVDDEYGGWSGNAPDLGPTTYKIWRDGITLNWGFDGIDPVAEGWVNGMVLVDEANFMWQVEAAIYVPQIETDSQIGFNVGGATAHPDPAFIYDEEAGAAEYAYFAYHQTSDPGDINRAAESFSILSFGDTGVGVEESPLDELPSSFTLEQNYPNPFNPTTTIEYGLQRAGHVSLAVFNTLGQQVATLIDGPRAAGTYRAQWQALDLPSGIYLYRLQVDGDIVAMKKMMLIK